MTEFEVSEILELLSMINTKLDQLTEKVTKIENNNNSRTNNFKREWSIENYKKSILVKFDYNRELIEFIKNCELGGIWISSMKAWMFPKSIENEVIEQITNKVANWKFIDLRK